MSVGKKTEGTKGEDITDGIIIQPWTVKNDSGVEVTYSTWDFAGQTLYYNTHQVSQTLCYNTDQVSQTLYYNTHQVESDAVLQHSTSTLKYLGLCQTDAILQHLPCESQVI